MTTLFDLVLAVLDRGGGLGVVLVVVLGFRLRVTVNWTRATGLRFEVRL